MQSCRKFTSVARPLAGFIGSLPMYSVVSQTSSLYTQNRGILLSGDVVDHPPYSFRRRHTYRTLPLHDANRFGGRTAYLREIGPFDHKRRGRLFKRNHELSQWNVDVWCAQQTLRKKWKGRDWVVMELPFLCSPRLLQRVIPEIFTDLPPLSEDINGTQENNVQEGRSENASGKGENSDGHRSTPLELPTACKGSSSTLACSYTPPEDDRFHRFQTNNIRHKVFDVEELQHIVFGDTQGRNRLPYPSIRKVDSSALTLEKFL